MSVPRRLRVVKPGVAQTVFESIKHFESVPVRDGISTIPLGDQFLDVLVQARACTTTLVVFHSALSGKHTEVPVFQGEGVAADAGVNLVAVSDPSVALGDVDLAWFLGNRGIGRLPRLLVPVIEHALRGLRTERTILMGSSGGGYAAALYGQFFQGCTVLALNPRLDLNSPPFAKVNQYLRVCHGVDSQTARDRIRREFVTDSLSDAFRGSMNHHVLVAQNLGDDQFLNNQTLPFARALQDEGTVFLRFGQWGEGHVPVARADIVNMLFTLASPAQGVEVYFRAGFLPAREALTGDRPPS